MRPFTKQLSILVLLSVSVLFYQNCGNSGSSGAGSSDLTLLKGRQAPVGSDKVAIATTASKAQVYLKGALAGHYLEIEQESLIEYDAEENKVQIMNLGHAGGMWSDVAEYDGQEHLFSSQYVAQAKSAKDVKAPGNYAMTLIAGVLTSIHIQDVPCQNCSGGSSGRCQNRNTLLCTELSWTGCPRRFTACTAEEVIEKDTIYLKFNVENWVFQQASNTLHMRFRLKIHKDPGHFSKPNEDYPDIDANYLLNESGLFQLPGQARIVGNVGETQDIPVSITATIGEGDEPSYIELIFPAFAEGESLFYN